MLHFNEIMHNAIPDTWECSTNGQPITIGQLSHNLIKEIKDGNNAIAYYNIVLALRSIRSLITSGQLVIDYDNKQKYLFLANVFYF